MLTLSVVVYVFTNQHNNIVFIRRLHERINNNTTATDNQIDSLANECSQQFDGLNGIMNKYTKILDEITKKQ